MKALTILTLVSTLTFSSVIATADEIALPPMTDLSASLQEGLERNLTDRQIAELLPWAKDSKIFMADLLVGIENYSSDDKIEKLIDGIKYIVEESAPKNSELLMRYALNRGLALYQIMNNEMQADAIGTADAKIRVLIQSIKMASKYVDQDIQNMTDKKSKQFADFGGEYFLFIAELNKSIFDASAQYLILRTSLEYLQLDLYRDLDNKKFASQIVKLNNALKTLPNKRLKDSTAISSIRQIKQMVSTLGLEDVLQVIKGIRKKEQDERNEILKQQEAKKQAEDELAHPHPKGRVGFDGNTCRTISADGKYFMDTVSNTKCEGGKYGFDGFTNTCRTISADGKYFMDKVSNTKCESGKYGFDGNTNTCRTISADGKYFMDKVTNDHCQ